MKAGFGPHGVAVTDTILAYGGRRHLTDWQVEVNHAVKEIGLSFNTDAVLALPTRTSEGPPLRARQRHHDPGPPRT